MSRGVWVRFGFAPPFGHYLWSYVYDVGGVCVCAVPVQYLFCVVVPAALSCVFVASVIYYYVGRRVRVLSEEGEADCVYDEFVRHIYA